MPLGLTNAPTSFQSLMNHVFQAFLRKFLIVFFDGILEYSSDLQAHISHLSQVFELVRDNYLFLNKNNCCFATDKVEYLGHFITKEGVSTDPAKVQAIAL